MLIMNRIFMTVLEAARLHRGRRAGSVDHETDGNYWLDIPGAQVEARSQPVHGNALIRDAPPLADGSLRPALLNTSAHNCRRRRRVVGVVASAKAPSPYPRNRA